MDSRKMSAFFHRLARGMAAETMGEQSDGELVERFLASRDDTVFEAIVRRHGPMIFRVCWRVLQDEQEAEEGRRGTARGEEARDGRYTVQNVHATIYRFLGIDPATTFPDRAGRP